MLVGRRLRYLSYLAILLSLAPTPASAQAEPAPGPATLCFRGRPAESCKAFLLTEVSLSPRGFRTFDGGTDYLQWDAGAMINVGERSAAGATFSFGADGDDHWGAAARYRHWLNRGFAVDFAPGFVVVGNDHLGKSLRLTANVSVSAGDWVGVFAHGESNRDGGQAGAGVKLGSWLGTIVGSVLYGLIWIYPET